jgi:3-phenylpropionate/trans-cinnamate dioxygenase ferredoxin subunit
VCDINDLERDDVVGIKINGKIYAIYYIASGYYATDGLCSHEQASLIDGYVSEDFVECPKHNARFHIPTGKALKRPACIDIKTYAVKEQDGVIFIGLPE